MINSDGLASLKVGSATNKTLCFNIGKAVLIYQCSALAVFAGRGALPLFGDALPFFKS